MLHMRRSGRVSVIGIMAVIGIAMLLVVLFFSKQSLSNAGSQFMDALARGDVDKLTDLTVLGSESPDQIRKQWEFATHVAGRNYSFRWRVTNELQISPDSGSVQLSVERNFGTGGSYEQNYALPMVKVDNKWKVDVGNISREMYPGLPKSTSF